MLKRILIGAGALFALLAAIVVGRTLMVPAMELEQAGTADSIDADNAARLRREIGRAHV